MASNKRTNIDGADLVQKQCFLSLLFLFSVKVGFIYATLTVWTEAMLTSSTHCFTQVG